MKLFLNQYTNTHKNVQFVPKLKKNTQKTKINDIKTQFDNQAMLKRKNKSGDFLWLCTSQLCWNFGFCIYKTYNISSCQTGMMCSKLFAIPLFVLASPFFTVRRYFVPIAIVNSICVIFYLKWLNLCSIWVIFSCMKSWMFFEIT